MKSFIVLALLVVAAAAAPQGGPDADAQIVKQFYNIDTDGYEHSFLGSNGISAQETGTLNNAGTENEALEVSGQYSYMTPDGVVHSVSYVADENGFQPQGT